MEVYESQRRESVGEGLSEYAALEHQTIYVYPSLGGSTSSFRCFFGPRCFSNSFTSKL